MPCMCVFESVFQSQNVLMLKIRGVLVIVVNERFLLKIGIANALICTRPNKK